MPVPAAAIPADAPDRHRAVWPYLLLVLLAGLGAYHNSFGGAFVFDDQGAILDNPTLRRLWPISAVLRPPIEGLPVTGRPLTNLSLGINYAIHGSRPLGFHVVNLAIHLACALALFGAIRRTLELSGDAGPRVAGIPVAGATALLWVVHPLTTGGVTYISQRAESLASMLIAVGIYAFARSATSRYPRRWLIGVALATWLGIGVKEITAALPVLVALYDRLFLRASWREVFRAHPIFYAVLFASWLPLLALMASTENRGGTWAAEAGIAPWDYLRIQCHALVHYLRLVFWPEPLVFDYGRNVPVPGWIAIIPAAVLLLTLLTATLWGFRRAPRFAFCGAAFFLILGPTSSFLPIADPIFEHRMYLPAAAVIAVVIAWVYRHAGPRLWWGAAPAALALAFATIDRNADFVSPLRLWTDTVAKRPDNARARGNLAKELIAAGRLEDALPHLKAAHQLAPQQAVSSHNLASGLELVGHTEEAERLYRETLQLQPDNQLAHTALANLLAQHGRLDESLALFDQVVAQHPEFVDARIRYGEALLRAARPADAAGQFRHAVRLKPEDAALYFFLGDASARAGELEDAIVAWRTAVDLRPDHAAAWNNLGNALLMTRQVPQAIEALGAALRLAPDPTTYSNLGYALLLNQQRTEAIAQFEAALRLDPDHPTARAGLDRAHGRR